MSFIIQSYYPLSSTGDPGGNYLMNTKRASRVQPNERRHDMETLSALLALSWGESTIDQ